MRVSASLRLALITLSCTVCLIMSACAQADDSAPADVPQASSVPVKVTPATVPKLQLTAMPPVGITTGVLGGVSAAFGVNVDSIDCCTELGWSSTSSAGSMSVDVLTDSGVLDVSSRTQRIIGLWITPAGSMSNQFPEWDAKTSAAVCQQYVPPDAVYQRTTAVTDNIGTHAVRIFSSVLLAHSVKPADFLDVSGHAQLPGTFYEYIVPDEGDLMGYGGCGLSTDEYYALEGHSSQ